MVKYTRYVIVFHNGEHPEPADRLFFSKEAAELEGESICDFLYVKEITLVLDMPKPARQSKHFLKLVPLG